MTEVKGLNRLILDTNAFLFFINNDPLLSEQARLTLESEAELLISSVSLWEIAIKVSIGKLALPKPFGSFIPAQLRQNDIDILHIELPHLAKVSTLTFHHKDPFDRFIIAQSLVEELPVATSDAAFDMYGIQRIW